MCHMLSVVDKGDCSAFGSLLLYCVTKKCKTGSWASLLPPATEHWQFLKLTVVVRAGNTIMLCNLGRTYVKCLIIMYNFFIFILIWDFNLGNNLITFKIISMEIFVIAFSSKKANFRGHVRRGWCINMEKLPIDIKRKWLPFITLKTKFQYKERNICIIMVSAL